MKLKQPLNISDTLTMWKKERKKEKKTRNSHEREGSEILQGSLESEDEAQGRMQEGIRQIVSVGIRPLSATTAWWERKRERERKTNERLIEGNRSCGGEFGERVPRICSDCFFSLYHLTPRGGAPLLLRFWNPVVARPRDALFIRRI